MKIEQYTYWSMTINNPEENDWVLVRNPNEKYVRQLIHTREIGEEGTEHIQAWIRMQRNVTMVFMKKLYPRAHFRFIDRDEYNENTQAYAQKNDDTTGGYHVNNINDPLPANDTLLYKVLERSITWLIDNNKKFHEVYLNEKIHGLVQVLTLKQLDTRFHEKLMVTEKAGLEKIFCSPAYEKMKTTFWKEILIRIYTKQDVQQADNSTDGGQTQVENRSTTTNSDNYEESASETYEGSTESSSVETDEEYDS